MGAADERLQGTGRGDCEIGIDLRLREEVRAENCSDFSHISKMTVELFTILWYNLNTKSEQTNRNLAKECDCMKKKFFVVIAIIAVLVILLTPVRMNLKDGGSVRYKALVYEVTKIHQLAPEVDGVKRYIDGFEIKILGMTVYRETNE